MRETHGKFLSLIPFLDKDIRQRENKIRVLESENEELRNEVQTLKLCLVEGQTLYGHAITRLQDQNSKNMKSAEMIDHIS
jgi:hypothetical protein